MDVATTPRVYRIRAYHEDTEIVNTTTYLLDSEVTHARTKIRERLVCVYDNTVKVEIYPA